MRKDVCVLLFDDLNIVYASKTDAIILRKIGETLLICLGTQSDVRR